MTISEPGALRFIVLMGSSADDALHSCYLCAAPSFPGAPYFVAVEVDAARFGFACLGCARRAEPAMTTCVEALNSLAAHCGDLNPDNQLRIAGALIGLIAPVTVPRKFLIQAIERTEP